MQIKKFILSAVPSGSAIALAVLMSHILTHPSIEAVTAHEDDPEGKWQEVAEAPAKARSLDGKKGREHALTMLS